MKITDIIENYYKNLSSLFSTIRVTNGNGVVVNFNEGIKKVCDLITFQAGLGHKLMFIGNGASAAISSHMSTDFWKNGGIRAVAFNDSSLLTCLGNDYGYKYVFEKSLEMFADEGDVLLAISSSGKSENILRGVSSAKSRECKVITLSGFKKSNPLSLMGDLNFYVPAESYGPVEIIHHSICHCILDTIINQKHT